MISRRPAPAKPSTLGPQKVAQCGLGQRCGDVVAYGATDATRRFPRRRAMLRAADIRCCSVGSAPPKRMRRPVYGRPRGYRGLRRAVRECEQGRCVRGEPGSARSSIRHVGGDQVNGSSLMPCVRRYSRHTVSRAATSCGVSSVLIRSARTPKNAEACRLRGLR